MFILSILLACTGSENPAATSGTGTNPATVTEAAPAEASFGTIKPYDGATPAVFTLDVSPYPSWNLFDVADIDGDIDRDQGEMGAIEKKWNVDIVLATKDYVPTLTDFASTAADAVAVTNTDAYNVAEKRASVAILANSTSFGADAVVADGTVKDLAAAKGKAFKGAAHSVSDYLLYRCAQKAGLDPADYVISDMDPGAVATLMQQMDADTPLGVLWNPFTQNALQSRPDLTRLCDSTAIPGEIVDMVMVGADALRRPGGPAFAMAVNEAYYTATARLADPATHAATIESLGRKFSDLAGPQMEPFVVETKIYGTPGQGLAVFDGAQFRSDLTGHIAEFSTVRGMVERAVPPTVFPGDAIPSGAYLQIDPTYMKEAQSLGL